MLVPHSLAFNPVLGRGVKYRYIGQGVSGSSALNFALRLQDMEVDERMLEVFDNDSIRRILRVRRRDCVPSMELRRRHCLTSIPALFVQRRLR